MKLSSKQRRTTYRLLFWSAAAFAVWFGFFSGFGAVTRWQLESDCSTLRNDIVRGKQGADSLRAYLDALQFDTLEIERLARERYGMIKSGEVVYVFRAIE